MQMMQEEIRRRVLETRTLVLIIGTRAWRRLRGFGDDQQAGGSMNRLRRSFNKAAANVARTCNHSNNINRNRFGKIQNCERECR